MSVASEVQPRILSRSEHPISRKQISGQALKVLYRLHGAGYKAHLVGGSVRDLMLGRRPKDFDIGTNARPNEIRRLFSNSRIIGRRFRLVHVFFQDGETVEVSTFRRDPRPEDQETAPGDLLITSDNTYGTPREDAFRRDFTVNALFYDIADFSVIDHVGGIEDLERQLIRTIGEPGVRFQEDPVRMLRACEFAGRLGFGIEKRTQEALHLHSKELSKASPARMTEEIIQLFRCGRSGAATQWLLDLGILEVILPEAYAMVAAGERGLGEFGQILPSIDRMVASGRTLSDSGALAAILLPQVMLRRHDIEALNQRPMGRAALDKMTEEAVAPFFARFTLSNLKSQQVLSALHLFQRLIDSGWSAGERLRIARRAGFEDALLLFEILVAATGDGADKLEVWRAAAARARSGEMPPPEELVVAPKRPRRRRRRTGRPAGAASL